MVALGERSGYDLARIAERTVGLIWAPSRSQLYKTLAALGRAGFVEGTRIAQQARPDKTVYSITAAGRAELETWLRDVDDDPTGGRIVFPLKIFFCDLVGSAVAKAQLDAYERYLRRVGERLDFAEQLTLGSPYADLVLEHGRSRVAATLDWISAARVSLRTRSDPRLRSQRSRSCRPVVRPRG